MSDIQAVGFDSVSCTSGSLPDLFSLGWGNHEPPYLPLIVRTSSYSLPLVVGGAGSGHAEGDGFSKNIRVSSNRGRVGLVIIHDGVG